MITALLAISTTASAIGQFADAYTTYVNVHVKKNAVEANRIAFIQWLVNDHPFFNMILKTILGAAPTFVVLAAPIFTSDISTILGLKLGAIIGTTFGAVIGFTDARHNYKLGKK